VLIQFHAGQRVFEVPIADSDLRPSGGLHENRSVVAGVEPGRELGIGAAHGRIGSRQGIRIQSAGGAHCVPYVNLSSGLDFLGG
jgi:hypothetical protein